MSQNLIVLILCKGELASDPQILISTVRNKGGGGEEMSTGYWWYLKGGDNGEIELEEKRCQLPDSGPAKYLTVTNQQKTSALYNVCTGCGQ
jgi:hypothetical protein